MHAPTWSCCVMALMIAFEASADDGTTADQKGLQGTWKILAGNEGGKTLPPARVRGSKVIVTGNTMKVYEQDKQREMTFTLDATTEPKTIDMTTVDGKKQGPIARGVYALDGNTLKICFAAPGRPRPASLLPRQGSAEMLFVMKRVQP
jgi:uncharacterized protein (TIGR03067 family)